jgi:hypothetical protein
MGQGQQGVGQMSTGTGINLAGSSWHPTVLYMLGLIVVEMFVFGWLGRVLK